MPIFKRGDVTLYFEEFGSGYPILLFAPGGMRSSIEFWHKSPFDPTVELAKDFRVIAMDQRNAGQSRAPVTASDGWETYAADHVALLDHLGIKSTPRDGRMHRRLVLARPHQGDSRSRQRGGAAAADRTVAAESRNVLSDVRRMGGGAEEGAARARCGGVPAVSRSDVRRSSDFVFNVSRDFVRKVQTPMLVLRGNDDYHPSETSDEIATIAPHAEIIHEWKTPATVGRTVERVRAFLKAHTPK